MKRYSAGKSSNVRLNLMRTCREHMGPNKGGIHQNPCGCCNHKDMMKVNAPKINWRCNTPTNLDVYIAFVHMKKDMSRIPKKTYGHRNLYDISYNNELYMALDYK